MHPLAKGILSDLERVARERRERAAQPSLERAVTAVKTYQHLRFERTYADMLVDAEYAPAARFFLDELYGPHDFTQRDAEFARVVPTIVRLFPDDLVETVASLASLHALSEELDSEMGRALGAPTVDASSYVRAWQRIDRAHDRERQLVLMAAVGRDLGRLTRKGWLRRSLHLMRAPAHAAGLGALQEFLECGFDTFGALRDPAAFLATIEARERLLAGALFSHSIGMPIPADGVFGQLP